MIKASSLIPKTNPNDFQDQSLLAWNPNSKVFEAIAKSAIPSNKVTTRSATPPSNPQSLDVWEMTDECGLTLLHTWLWIPGNATVPGKWVSKDTQFFRRSNLFLQDTTNPLPNESFIMPFPEALLADKKISTFLKRVEIHETAFTKAQDAQNYYEFQIFTTLQGGTAAYGSSVHFNSVPLGRTSIANLDVAVEADFLGVADWSKVNPVPNPAIQKLQQAYIQVARKGIPGIVLANINFLYSFQYYP